MRLTLLCVARSSILVLEPPCPHLLTASSSSTTQQRCWEQATAGGTKEQLLYSASPNSMTAIVPPTLQPSCGGRQLATARYQDGALQCVQ